MKEEYVKLGTAKLLKEAGFDWDTDKVYERSLMACRYEDYPMPTQQMAMRWLREEKDIYVTAVPDIGNSLRFYPAIYVMKGEMPEEYWFEHINSVVEELNKSYGEPQQAIDVALQYVLKNLI